MAKKPADGNPSPPKTKPVIGTSLNASLDAVGQPENEERASIQDMAMNNSESFEKNPSPPRTGSTIGNA